MHSGADVDVELFGCGVDGEGAADGAGGSVEGGEEVVAAGVDLAAAEAGQLVAYNGAEAVEEFAPGPVAELGGTLGRADDVGEQHRGEDPVGRFC